MHSRGVNPPWLLVPVTCMSQPASRAHGLEPFSGQSLQYMRHPPAIAGSLYTFVAQAMRTARFSA